MLKTLLDKKTQQNNTKKFSYIMNNYISFKIFNLFYQMFYEIKLNIKHSKRLKQNKTAQSP